MSRTRTRSAGGSVGVVNDDASLPNAAELPPGLQKVLTAGPYLVGLGVFVSTSLVGVIAMWIAGNDGARWLPFVVGFLAGAWAVSRARAAIDQKLVGLRALQDRLAAAAARPVGDLVNLQQGRGVVDVNGPSSSSSSSPSSSRALEPETIDMTPERDR